MINNKGYGQLLTDAAKVSGLVIMQILLVHLPCFPDGSLPEIHVAANFYLLQTHEG